MTDADGGGDPVDAFDPFDDLDALSEGPGYCTYTSYEVAERPTPETVPATGAEAEGVERAVFDELATVEDPEMPVSVVDLGLIYDVDVTDAEATVTMTLTYTGCPARDYLTEAVRQAAAQADGVDAARVALVWSPEWSVDMVTEDGREALREFGVSV